MRTLLSIALSIILSIGQGLGGTAGIGGNAGFGGGVVAATTPDVIFGASLKRWYRADATVCGGGACSNGNNIDTFTDKAGNGDATWTGTGSHKVVYTTGGLNGQVIGSQTTGAAGYTIGGTAYTPVSFSCYAVVKITDSTVVSAIFGGSAASGQPAWRINATTGVQDLVLPGVADIGTSNTNLGTSNYHKIAFTYNSSTGAFAFYTDSDSTDGTGTNAHSPTNPLNILFNIDGSNGSPFLGDWAELVIVDGVSNGTQITQMMGSSGYFHTRYGL